MTEVVVSVLKSAWRSFTWRVVAISDFGPIGGPEPGVLWNGDPPASQSVLPTCPLLGITCHSERVRAALKLPISEVNTPAQPFEAIE
jgi:hypothetical protein